MLKVVVFSFTLVSNLFQYQHLIQFTDAKDLFKSSRLLKLHAPHICTFQHYIHYFGTILKMVSPC